MTDNYEYIIASLPLLTKDFSFQDENEEYRIFDFISENCSAKDRKLIEMLLGGFDENCLNADFYEKALNSKNKFIREYFRFDLALRNTKVEHLNSTLGRASGTDIFMNTEISPDDKKSLDDIFSEKDLYAREKKIDDLLRNKIDEIVLFDYFNINVILAFLAKFKIMLRWFHLDEATGKEKFKQLISEITSTFKGIPDLE